MYETSKTAFSKSSALESPSRTQSPRAFHLAGERPLNKKPMDSGYDIDGEPS